MIAAQDVRTVSHDRCELPRRVAAHAECDRAAGCERFSFTRDSRSVRGREFERGRRRDGVDDSVEMSVADGPEDERCVGVSVSRERLIRPDADRHGPERGFVAGQRQNPAAVGGIAAQAEPRVRICPGDRHDAAPRRERCPLIHDAAGVNQAAVSSAMTIIFVIDQQSSNRAGHSNID